MMQNRSTILVLDSLGIVVRRVIVDYDEADFDVIYNLFKPELEVIRTMYNKKTFECVILTKNIEWGFSLVGRYIISFYPQSKSLRFTSRSKYNPGYLKYFVDWKLEQ